MPGISQTILSFLFSLLLFGTALSQTQTPGTPSAIPIVTATASNEWVRCISAGEVHQTRLQVFFSDGTQVFDSDFRLGNLVDWKLQDQQGQHLIDGAYLFLVTVRDFSGNLTQKFGTAVLEQQQVYLEQANRDELPQAQAAALESNRQAKVLTTIDRIGAAGLNRAASTTSADNNPATNAQSPSKATSSNLTTGGTNVLGAGTANYLTKWQDNVGNLMDSSVTEVGGNVGIGTALPTRKLSLDTGTHVYQSFNVGGAEKVAIGSEVGTNRRFVIFDTPGSAYRFVINDSGNVGIGAIAPTRKLSLDTGTHVYQSFNVGGTEKVAIGSEVGVNRRFVIFDTPNSAYRFVIDEGGNIGVGTTAPTRKLSLDTGTHVYQSFNVGGAEKVAIGSEVGTNRRFVIFDTPGSAYRFVINDSGNVGIGTTNPTVKLEVDGGIKASGTIEGGNIKATYQDVAEWVPASQPLAAGTVVSLDLTRANAVSPSACAYDIHVAGVVSTRPGVILGEGGAGKVLVATTGRVRVRVDATNHPIKIGDLLVASDKHGIAMRSQPIRVGRALLHRPGTIIGKALEPLAKGKGEILVLLSLQ